MYMYSSPSVSSSVVDFSCGKDEKMSMCQHLDQFLIPGQQLLSLFLSDSLSVMGVGECTGGPIITVCILHSDVMYTTLLHYCHRLTLLCTVWSSDCEVGDLFDRMPFLTAHGTFVGSLRLEAFKPTQIPIDTTISFGASTRTYTLRYIKSLSVPTVAICNR